MIQVIKASNGTLVNAPFHVIAHATILGTRYALLEHDVYGDESMCFLNCKTNQRVRDEDGCIVTAHNGFDDLHYFLEN